MENSENENYSELNEGNKNSSTLEKQQNLRNIVSDVARKAVATTQIATALTGAAMNPQKVELGQQLKDHYVYEQKRRIEDREKELEVSSKDNQSIASGSPPKLENNEQEDVSETLNQEQLEDFSSETSASADECIESHAESNESEDNYSELEDFGSETSEGESGWDTYETDSSGENGESSEGGEAGEGE